MNQLIDWLISRPAVRRRLIELGWTEPEAKPKAKVKSGPGPWRPPK